MGDVSLTGKGVQEATKTARALEGKNIVKIISSPALRARQTADIVGKPHRLQVEIDPRLRERIDYGDTGTLDYRQYLYLCNKSTHDRDFILPNGESSRKSGQRLKEVISDAAILTGDIMIVGHGGNIADYLRNTFPDSLLDSENDFFGRYKIVQSCSITHLKYNRHTKMTKLVSLNNIVHLL